MVRFIAMATIAILMSCCGSKKKSVTAPVTKTNNTTINTTAAKENQPTETVEGIVTTIKVIRVSCASIVAIITDDSQVDKGEQWAPYNVRMVKPYKGAFSFINHNAMVGKVKENYVFKAKLLTAKQITTDPEPRCAMEDYPPAQHYHVTALATPKEDQ